MAWVKRQQGVIVGVYKSIQHGTAEEELSNDHPEIVAFRAARAVRLTPEQRMRNSIVDDPFRKALTKLLAADRGLTNQQMVQLLVDQLQP